MHIMWIKIFIIMESIIRKQLLAYPNVKKQARIGYFEQYPLKQVHIDTMFWQTSGELSIESGQKSTLIPILCIVDVATRYTRYYQQKKKSETIKLFLENFIEDVKDKFPVVSRKMTLVSDGAPEFKALKHIKLGGIDITGHLSTGINKAVLAEVSIRQARAILREFEVQGNIKNLVEGTDFRIDSDNLQAILQMIEERINAKARIRKRKKPTEKQTPIPIGTPVFALNFYKFYPHAVKSTLNKKSYMTNFYYEPFEVVKYYGINGVYKYQLASYERTRPILKYYFYQDQLQRINPIFASEYIKKYHTNNLP